MNLKQIRYFCAVAEAGSFTAGARRAFVTQPTLSAAIAALERELGEPLFDRRARGVRLTPAGERRLAAARAVLREVEALRAAPAPSTRKPRRLGLLPTLPPTFAAATLAHLQALDPAQPWIAEDAALAPLRQRLAAGRYDAILCVLDTPARGHRQRELTRDAQALAVPRGTRGGGHVTPEILQGRPLVVRTHCEALHAASRILDDWRVKPRVVARTDSDARALALVAAGVGVCLMPDSLRHDDVVFLRPDGVHLPRRLGLEWIDRALDDALAGLRPALS
jgi:LysR family hydrogen peroxide-inducible transcriptional activator